MGVTYDIIYCDPPWDYKGQVQHAGKGSSGTGGALMHYPTMTLGQLKERVNPGFYTMSQCELCLVGKRGKIPRPRGARNERQLVRELRGVHSTKPEEVAVRIGRMFPEQRKIELFARRAREGWDVWGNEVEVGTDIAHLSTDPQDS